LSVDHRGKLISNTPLLMSQDELRGVVAQRHADSPKWVQIEVGVGIVGGIVNGWSAYMAVQLVELLGNNLSNLFESMTVQDAALVKLIGIEMGVSGD